MLWATGPTEAVREAGRCDMCSTIREENQVAGRYPSELQTHEQGLKQLSRQLLTAESSEVWSNLLCFQFKRADVRTVSARRIYNCGFIGGTRKIVTALIGTGARSPFGRFPRAMIRGSVGVVDRTPASPHFPSCRAEKIGWDSSNHGLRGYSE